MFHEIRLPELGEGVRSAKLTRWLKSEGDYVRAREAIAELETDKTSIELEAPCAGVLTHIHIRADTDSVAIGSLLAVIVESASATPAVLQTDDTSEIPAIPTVLQADDTSEIPERRHAPVDVNVTALAARMAKLAGLDLSAIHPADGRSRITRADIELALRQQQPAIPVSDASRLSEQSSSAMRRVAAARLQHAKQTIPHFYLEVDCNAGPLSQLRERLNTGNATKVTVTGLIMLASAQALRKVVLANSTWSSEGVRLYDSVDIAVAVNTPMGLITPIVRACEQKTIRTISRELRELGDRARQGLLKPAEYTGGTFTISNLGMFGVTRMTPIINPPQTCILGVGAIEQRPVATEGRTTIGEVMNLTLAADHRAVDGAAAAQLLVEIRRLVENPSDLAPYI